MRLLALHGRYQSGVRFAEKLAGFRVPKDLSSAQDPRLQRDVAQGGVSANVDSISLDIRRHVERLACTPTGPEPEPAYAAVRVRYRCGRELEVVAIDAPFEVVPKVNLGKNQTLRRKPQKTAGACATRVWWTKEKEAEELMGVDASVLAVRDAVDKLGPFDGGIGFSQGAALLGQLCTPEHEATRGTAFKLAVMCSGYPIQSGMDTAAGVASLHIFSRLDRMVRAELSEELAEQMGGRRVEHNGGHSLQVPLLYDEIYTSLAAM